MNQRLLFIIPLLLVMCQINAFSQKVKIIEPAQIEVQYTFSMQRDTVTRNQLRKDRMILRIGKDVSQFYNYGKFYGDSLANDPQGKKLWGKMMIDAIKSRNYDNMPGSKTMGEYLYKNYPKGKITTTTQGVTDFFTYEEDYKPQKWNISDSTKVILDYVCQKAECDFRGRHWTAWFAPDVPISDGPWKLNELPGLILEAYDSALDYKYTAIGIAHSNISDVSYFNFFEKKFIKTDRISFLKSEYKIYQDKSGNALMEASTGIDFKIDNEKNKKEMLYDFIELDYK